MSTLIMGAGDFAREVYEYHKFCGVPVDGFYDEQTDKISLRGKPIYKNLAQIPDIKNKQFILGTGSPRVNKIFLDLIHKHNLKLAPALVCDSYVGENVQIGDGSIICPKSVLTCDITIGRFVSVNISSTIGHDTVIGDCCVLSPNVSLSGHTTLQEGVFLGTSAVTAPKTFIPAHSSIGANSAVLKDLPEPGVYVGTPAKKIK